MYFAKSKQEKIDAIISYFKCDKNDIYLYDEQLQNILFESLYNIANSDVYILQSETPFLKPIPIISQYKTKKSKRRETYFSNSSESKLAILLDFVNSTTENKVFLFHNALIHNNHEYCGEKRTLEQITEDIYNENLYFYETIKLE